MTDATLPTPPIPPTPPVVTPPTPPVAAWYEGKVPDETLGFWKNKGWDVTDPVKTASGLTEAYRNIEKLVGVKPEELVRLPKANAEEADIRAFRTRLGVPLEAKDYDLSTVKRTDGKDLDQAFVDTVRAGLHEAGVPKDRAPGMVARLVKQQEATEAANAAEVTAKITEQKAVLDRNWGANKAVNLAAAQVFLEKIGGKAGLTPEQIKQGWDAISNVGGIGASYAMEMLLAGARATGEAPFIGGGPGPQNQPMSREGAIAEIEALKKDTAFGTRLKAGDRAAIREWENLHKIAYAAAA